MKKAYVILACLFASLVSVYCTQPQPKSKNKEQTTSKPKTSALEGFWILTDVVDSTVQNRAIAKYVLKNPIRMHYLVLDVQQDTLYSYGTIGNLLEIKLNLHNIKRLAVTKQEGKIPRCIISYNAIEKTIEFTDSIRKYVYRKFNEEEKNYFEKYQPKNSRYKIYPKYVSYYFEAMLLKGFIAGKYKAIDTQQDVQEFEIYSQENTRFKGSIDGKVRGFKKFTNVRFDHYVNTQWAFHQDGISFYERDKNQAVSEGGEPYSFEFKGDTLYLKDMVLDKGLMHYNPRGLKTYRFLKVR